MTEPFDYLDMSILGSSTKYDRVTLHRRPIFGGRQKYRKVFHAWCETRKDTTDTYKLKSKSDSKGQATDEAKLLFKDYYPNRWRKLHVKEELVPVKHRQKKSQATTPDS
jgi:hypothetical protein